MAEILSEEWTEKFRSRWNDKSSKFRSLRGTGVIQFSVKTLTGDFRSCNLEWDQLGVVAIVRGAANRKFESDIDGWMDFISGTQAAPILIMSGRIKYFGDLLFLTVHVRDFRRIAEIANLCCEPYL